jgi:hypothetical protein
LACFARLHAFATINAVRTTDAFLLAALASSLEFGRNNELAVDTSIITCFAWIVIAVVDERTVVITYLKACFAASALRMADR